MKHYKLAEFRAEIKGYSFSEYQIIAVNDEDEDVLSAVTQHMELYACNMDAQPDRFNPYDGVTFNDGELFLQLVVIWDISREEYLSLYHFL
jgi:hypothetical protein